MAGVKGRSGGPRANSGGARPGAGAKPKPKPEPFVIADGEVDPLTYLLGVMRGEIVPTQEQLKAAIAAAQYVHRKVGEGGKKDERATAAKVAATGKFAPAEAPLKLVSR